MAVHGSDRCSAWAEEIGPGHEAVRTHMRLCHAECAGNLVYLDFGMMSQAPQKARYAIINHVTHLVNRDYEATPQPPPDPPAPHPPAPPPSYPQPPPPPPPSRMHARHAGPADGQAWHLRCSSGCGAWPASRKTWTSGARAARLTGVILGGRLTSCSVPESKAAAFLFIACRNDGVVAAAGYGAKT